MVYKNLKDSEHAVFYKNRVVVRNRIDVDCEDFGLRKLIAYNIRHLNCQYNKIKSLKEVSRVDELCCIGNKIKDFSYRNVRCYHGNKYLRSHID